MGFLDFVGLTVSGFVLFLLLVTVYDRRNQVRVACPSCSKINTHTKQRLKEMVLQWTKEDMLRGSTRCEDCKCELIGSFYMHPYVKSLITKRFSGQEHQNDLNEIAKAYIESLSEESYNATTVQAGRRNDRT